MNSKLSTRNYLTMKYLSFIAAGGHLLILAYMIYIGQRPLAYFNIGSCALYVGCYYINQRRMHRTVLALAMLEIITHAYLSVLTLGWSYGFHLFIMCLIPLIFLVEGMPLVLRLVNAVLVFASYIGLALSAVDVRLETSSHQFLIARIANYLFTFVVLAALAFYYSRAAEVAEDALQAANDELSRQSRTDPLTGLPNRRQALERLDVEVSRMQRSGSSFCIALADLDDFKDINDRFGHDLGDEILKHAALVMRSNVRKYDFVARWGGEEFLFVFPDTAQAAGLSAAEKVRRAVETSSYTEHGSSIAMTITIGVSQFRDGSEVGECIRAADDAMYRGKNLGKNRAEKA